MFEFAFCRFKFNQNKIKWIEILSSEMDVLSCTFQEPSASMIPIIDYTILIKTMQLYSYYARENYDPILAGKWWAFLPPITTILEIYWCNILAISLDLISEPFFVRPCSPSCIFFLLPVLNFIWVQNGSLLASVFLPEPIYLNPFSSLLLIYWQICTCTCSKFANIK